MKGNVLGLGILLVGVFSMLPARSFDTGIPLIFTVDPPTVRQRGEEKTATVTATVTLKEPSPNFFVCKIRGENGDILDFPPIVFWKDHVTEISKGVIHWPAVQRDMRLRFLAYNVDAPDRQLAFTVILKPDPAPDDGQQQVVGGP
jgi:hypothetical protein